jgi:bacterioferritin
MKGNKKVLTALDHQLADELTAINQYMVHSEMCENWGYNKLHMDIRKQAMDEMHHAEWLIERIIFLEGLPTVSKLNPIKIGKTVSDMINNDNNDELEAVRSYNDAIKLARSVDDQGTVELLSKILGMEEGHVDWAEIQRAQIEQMGLENYLVNQTEGGAS